MRLLCLLLLFTFSAAVSQAQEVTAQVVLETEAGQITIELYGDNAPITVANFLRHADGGHYDGAEFYRAVDFSNDNGSPLIEVIQGGLNEAASPFPPINHETTQQTGILHTAGQILLEPVKILRAYRTTD